jgi:hypothetical protein
MYLRINYPKINYISIASYEGRVFSLHIKLTKIWVKKIEIRYYHKGGEAAVQR